MYSSGTPFTRNIALRSMVYSSRFSTTVDEWSSQRGVGCTQVVKPPFVIRYFFGPVFWMVSPKKYTSVSAALRMAVPGMSPPASAGASPGAAPGRVFWGPTGAMPQAL